MVLKLQGDDGSKKAPVKVVKLVRGGSSLDGGQSPADRAREAAEAAKTLYDEIDDLRRDLDAAQDKLAASEAAGSEERKRLGDQLAEAEKARKAAQEAGDQRQHEHEEAEARLKDAVASLDPQLAALKSDLAELRADSAEKLDQLARLADTLADRLRDLMGEAENGRKESESATQQALDQAKGEKAALGKALDEARKQTTDLLTKLDAAQVKANTLDKALRKSDDESKKLATQLADMDQANKALQDEVAKTQQAKQEVEEKLAAADKQAESLKAALDSKQKEIKSEKEKATAADTLSCQLKDRTKSQAQVADDLRQELAKVKSDLDVLRAEDAACKEALAASDQKLQEQRKVAEEAKDALGKLDDALQAVKTMHDTICRPTLGVSNGVGLVLQASPSGPSAADAGNASAPRQNDGPGRSSALHNKPIPLELVLDMDIRKIDDLDCFKAEVIGDVARAAGVKNQFLQITSIRSGSVVIDMLLSGDAVDEQGRGPEDIAANLEQQAKNMSSALLKGKHTKLTQRLNQSYPTRIKVLTVIDGGPAAASHCVQAGDAVLEVDGHEVSQRSLEDVEGMLVG